MAQTVYARLDPAAFLEVTGADAAQFLQGQFTNDLRSGAGWPPVYGLWLNHKGRVLADSLVVRRPGEAFWVISETSPAALIQQRLESFIIADDVAVTDRTREFAGWIVAGLEAAAVAAGLKRIAATAAGRAEADDLVAFPSRAGGPGSWSILGPAADATALSNRLEAAVAQIGGRLAAAGELDARRVFAGVPAIPTELGPGDLPPEGGLEQDAISYTKGCYLGQEVMARLRSMGQVRRRLFVVETETTLPATTLPAALFVEAKKVGELRSVFPTGDGRHVGMAMLQLNAVNAGTACAFAAEGEARVRVVRLAEGRGK